MSLLLDAGLHADLVLDGGWTARVIVSSVSPDAVDLRPADGHLRLPDRLDWIAATLEWEADGTTIRRAGILVAGERGMLHLEPIGVHPFEQRRRHERVPSVVPAHVSAGDAAVDARTVDVSVGGMLLEGAEGLDGATEVQFTLHLGDHAVSGRGAVVRTLPGGPRAVRFDVLDGTGASQLAHWLDAQVSSAA